MYISNPEHFKKLFKFKEHELIPEPQLGYFLDITNTIAVVPKTKEMRDMLLNNFKVKPHNPPKPFRHVLPDGSLNQGKYSVEFMKIISKILVHTQSDSIKFQLWKDSPLIIDVKEMTLVIAPMSDNGEIIEPINKGSLFDAMNLLCEQMKLNNYPQESIDLIKSIIIANKV